MSSPNERISPSDLLAVAAGGAPFLLILPIVAAAGTYLLMASTPPSFRAEAAIQHAVDVPGASVAPLPPLASGAGSVIVMEAQTADAAISAVKAELARLKSDLPEGLTSVGAAIDRETLIYQDLRDKIVQGLDRQIASQGGITERVNAIIRLNGLLRTLQDEKLSIESAKVSASNGAEDLEIHVERVSASPVRGALMAAIAAAVLVYVLNFSLWRWRIFAANPASMDRFNSTRKASFPFARFAQK